MSEIGFICNPNKGKAVAAVDMLTGSTYISEIQSVITSNGFYPLSAGGATGKFNQTPIDEGHVGHPATALIPSTNKYFQFDKSATNTSTGDPVGFCLTTTTDGNANSGADEFDHLARLGVSNRQAGAKDGPPGPLGSGRGRVLGSPLEARAEPALGNSDMSRRVHLVSFGLTGQTPASLRIATRSSPGSRVVSPRRLDSLVLSERREASQRNSLWAIVLSTAVHPPCLVCAVSPGRT